MRPRYGAKPKKKKKDTNGTTNGGDTRPPSRFFSPSPPKKDDTPSAFSPTDRAMMRMLTSALRENTKANESRLTKLLTFLENLGFEVEWIDGPNPHWVVKPPEDPVVRPDTPPQDDSEDDAVESDA